MLNIDTTLTDENGNPIGGAPAQSEQPQPAQQSAPLPADNSWWGRATANFQDAWRTGTLAGAATTMAQTGVGSDPAAVEAERKRKAEFDSMDSWMQAPDALGKLKNFSAMIAGQVAGGLASPESLVAAPLKAGIWAVKGATPLARLGRTAAVNAGTQAAVNTVVDPAVQGMNIASGVQDEFSTAQALAAPVVGAGLGAVAGATGLSGMRGDARTLDQAIKTREAVVGRSLEGWEREAIDVARQYLPPKDYDKYSANINLERIRAGEDVFALIKETAETHKTAIDALRRGSITNEELRGMASDLDMTPEKLLETVKPGSILNAENMLAARQLMVDSSVDTVGAAKAYTKSQTPEDLAKFLDSLDMSQKIIQAVTGPTAESGRLQQQFNVIISGEDRAKALQAVLSRNPELAQDAPAMAAMVSSLENPSAVRKMLRQVSPASGIEKFVEAWKAGLLTSFRTHEINMISNAVVNALNVPTEMLTSTIGKVRNLVDGKDDARSMTGAMSRIYATFTAPNDQLDAWINFKEAIKTAETPTVFATRTEQEQTNAILGKTGEVIRTPFRMLTAEDAFFKTIAARQELTAKAWDDLLKQENYPSMSLQDRKLWVDTYVANPPPEALKQAVEQANYLTFNKELGSVGQSIQNATEKHPALQFIIPFVRTPINIVKYGFEHTPLVLINPSYRNLKGQDFDRAVAKASMGSAFMMGMYGMAQEGKITGSGPQDPAELLKLKNTGWQPYSIKVGDKYYPYERVQPLGMLMGLASDMQYLVDELPQTIESRGKLTPEGTLSSSDLYATYGIHIFMENIVNSTFTTQINNLFEALNDSTGNKVDNFINSAAGSLVPNIVGDVAKAMDPTVRVADGPMDAIRARIPGMSQDLPASRSWTGEPRVREHGAMAQMLSPFHATTEKEDKAIREVARINYAMPQVPKVIGNRSLTPEQREVYAETAGQMRYNAIRAVVNSPGYDALAKGPGGDEKVRRAFAAATASANKAAEGALFKRFPELAGAEADQTIRAFGKQPRQEQRSLRN